MIHRIVTGLVLVIMFSGLFFMAASLTIGEISTVKSIAERGLSEMLRP